MKLTVGSNITPNTAVSPGMQADAAVSDYGYI